MRLLPRPRRLLLCCALACTAFLRAQIPGGSDDQEIAIPGGKAIHGAIQPGGTADHLSLRDDDGGGTFQVLLSPNTHVVRARQPIRAGDLKPGETVLAFGTYDGPNRSLHALFLSVIDPAELKRARDNLGKTYITGVVVAIDDLKLTIKRPDGVRQTISVDETTAFRRGGGRASDAGVTSLPDPGAGPASGEIATLADVHPGGYVMGTGAVKNGVFVPTVLRVSEPRAHAGDTRTAHTAAGQPQ